MSKGHPKGSWPRNQHESLDLNETQFKGTVTFSWLPLGFPWVSLAFPCFQDPLLPPLFELRWRSQVVAADVAAHVTGRTVAVLLPLYGLATGVPPWALALSAIEQTTPRDSLLFLAVPFAP